MQTITTTAVSAMGRSPDWSMTSVWLFFKSVTEKDSTMVSNLMSALTPVMAIVCIVLVCEQSAEAGLKHKHRQRHKQSQASFTAGYVALPTHVTRWSYSTSTSSEQLQPTPQSSPPAPRADNCSCPNGTCPMQSSGSTSLFSKTKIRHTVN